MHTSTQLIPSRVRAAPRMGAHERARLAAYLAVLTRHADKGALIELRVRRSGGMECSFVPAGDVDGVIAAVQRERRRSDVYIGVAPRARRAGTKDAVAQLATLWVDVDGPGAIAALWAFRPAPAMLVDSGGGAHAYWLLERPVAPAVGERANARLAHACGGCACWDAGRILRPPSTWNFGYDPPRPVELIRMRPEARVSAAAIIAQLPEPPGVEASIERRWAPAGDRDTSGDPLLAIDARVYVEALVGPVGRNGKATCPFHDDHKPSLQTYGRRGWYCFGCRRGGRIYDLAAELWGLGTRKHDFVELERRLRQRFLPSSGDEPSERSSRDR